MCPHFRHSAITVILLLATFVPCRADDERPPTEAPRWAVGVLSRRDLEPDPAALCRWLESRLPDEAMRVRVEKLIEELSAREFRDRERATAELMRVGRHFRARLERLSRTGDPEVASRIGRVLGRIRRSPGDEDETATLAALCVLRARPTAAAVVPLLESLPYVESGDLRDLAAEVVWLSVDRSHLERVRSAMRHADRYTRATAVVALEAILDDEAVAEIEPLLKSDDALVRIAAARALMEHRPTESWNGFHAGFPSRDSDVKRAAAMGAAVSYGLAAIAKDWLTTKVPRAAPPKGRQRWINTTHEIVHLEDFTTTEPVTIAKEFRGMRVETKDSVRPVVDRGELRIPSPKLESDVRVVLPLADLLPRKADEWRIVVDVRSDGESPVAWHPGISVGGFKFLFHPGYATGAFRVESTTDHTAHVSNQNMGYTPRVKTFHRVRIDVTRTGPRMEFRINDPETGDAFRHTFEPSDDDETAYSDGEVLLTPLSRVGLERSGRSGGTATFRNLRIEVPRKLR